MINIKSHNIIEINITIVITIVITVFYYEAMLCYCISFNVMIIEKQALIILVLVLTFIQWCEIKTNIAILKQVTNLETFRKKMIFRLNDFEKLTCEDFKEHVLLADT